MKGTLNKRLHLLLLLVPLSAIGANARELDPTNLPEAWIELITGLRERLPLRAEFRETRRLPFRSKAVELQGILRLDPEAGVSLHYPGDGDAVTNLVDHSGLATRRNKGKWRPLPDRPELRAIHEAVASLLTLDLPALGQSYTIDGTLEDGDWRLRLDPAPGSPKGRLEGLSIAGNRHRVTRIEANLGGDRGFIIEILNEETRVTLRPDEYALYFR